MTGLLRAALLCAGILAWLPAAAHDCDPLAVSSGVQIGTASKTVRTAAGSADVWWCQYTNASTPPGKVNWRAQYVIDLKECHDLTALAGAIGRIVASPSYATVEAELRAAATGCVVQPGTPRHYDAMMLRYLGCLELVKPPLVPNFDTPLPADWCGAQPVPPPPPPPPPGVYIVSGTVAYPLRADGTRSTTAWPTAPIRGEACDCSVMIPNQFGGRYCKVPRLSTTQTVVAGCTLKP